MPARSVPLTGLPGTSRLLADFAADFPKTSGLYTSSPFDSSSYKLAAEAVDYPAGRRAALVEALGEQNPGHPLLGTLAAPRTLVVATGQQVGLFGGPAYSIYKALTAVRLARSLTVNGIPAVPVFWMATNDHDLAEVNHAWVFDAAQRPVRIEAEAHEGSGRPVGPLIVGDRPLDQLRQTLAGLPFAGQVQGLAEAAYAPGRSYGQAFQALMSALLGDCGVLFLDPLRPAVRRMAAPILAQAVERAPELVRLVLARNRELETRGYHAQVLVDESSTLLFTMDGGRRVPLRLSNGAVRGGVEPERLSPNALLRPVVQDYIFPTVATVMGPAEVAYMAQAGVLYTALLGRAPVVALRAGFTLAGAGSVKLMERYGLELADLAQGEEAVRARIAQQLVPPPLRRRIEEEKAAAEARLYALRTELAAFDPSLAEAMDRSRRKILYQIGKMERKTAREALRRDQRAGEQAGRLVRLLYPHRQLQERFYSILPFLAEHGPGLIETISDNVRLDSPDHQLLAL